MDKVAGLESIFSVFKPPFAADIQPADIKAIDKKTAVKEVTEVEVERYDRSGRLVRRMIEGEVINIRVWHGNR